MSFKQSEQGEGADDATETFQTQPLQIIMKSRIENGSNREQED